MLLNMLLYGLQSVKIVWIQAMALTSKQAEPLGETTWNTKL